MFISCLGNESKTCTLHVNARPIYLTYESGVYYMHLQTKDVNWYLCAKSKTKPVAAFCKTSKKEQFLDQTIKFSLELMTSPDGSIVAKIFSFAEGKYLRCGFDESGDIRLFPDGLNSLLGSNFEFIKWFVFNYYQILFCTYILLKLL